MGSNTKYFAQLDGQQKGPFTLQELIAAGVRPDTYVWAKGMVDWQRAKYVADICRAFRQHLSTPYGAENPAQESTPTVSRPPATLPDEDSNQQPIPLMRGGMPLPAEDYSKEPTYWVAAIILSMVMLLPIGIAAFYYYLAAKKIWQATEQNAKSAEERSHLQEMSHSYARRAKMLAGIGICLGLILYATLIRFAG